MGRGKLSCYPIMCKHIYSMLDEEADMMFSPMLYIHMFLDFVL